MLLFQTNLQPASTDITSGTSLPIKTLNKYGVTYGLTMTLALGTTTYFEIPTTAYYVGTNFTFNPAGTGTLVLSYCIEEYKYFEADPASCVWIPSTLGSITTLKYDEVIRKITGVKIVTTGCNWTTNIKL